MKVLITFDQTVLNPENWLILHPEQLNNFNDYVDDNECKELVLNNILQYIPFTQIPNLLSFLIKKLRHGGLLTITFVETIEVFKTFINGQLSLANLNQAIFGNNNKHLSIISIPTICEVLENHGLKIRLKQLNGSSALVKAERE